MSDRPTEDSPEYVCPWMAGDCVGPDHCAPALMYAAQGDDEMEVQARCPILHALNMAEAIAMVIYPLLEQTGTKGRIPDEVLNDRDRFITECVRPDQLQPGDEGGLP